MNRLTTSFGAGVLVAAAFAFSSPAHAQGGAASSAVERGRYLVQITGCHDCHSPKVEGMVPDLKRALSGRPSTTPLPTAAKGEVHASLDLTAWQGPWGASVASNLTPDAATGLGTRYSEATFITTMRTGKKPNGTMILPPMPADVYKNMSDDDLKAIFAYLKTIPAIRNAVYAGLPPPGAAK
jgi:cytochrome c553